MRCLAFPLFVCIFMGCSPVQPPSHNHAGPSQPTIFLPGVMVTMRDGVRLSANIYKPAGGGTHPVILRRTPYGSGDSANADGLFFARNGYIFISQDTRGRYGSEGIFDAFRYEKQDGEDMHRWIAQQTWFNGQLATQGGSYVGFSQWMPAPTSKHLKAMFTWVSFSSLYEALYHQGAFYLDFAANWSRDMTRPYQVTSGLPMDSLLRSRPAIAHDSLWGWRTPFLRDWILHPEKDDFWNKTQIDNAHRPIAASVYCLGGWFDLFLKSTIQDYLKLTSIKKRKNQRHKLVIGPWQHVPGQMKAGALDFGSEALIDLRQLQLEWFDTALKRKAFADTLPPVRIFVMGKNEWRYENEWPLARTRYTPYFLGSTSGANSSAGDGTLGEKETSIHAGQDSYIYNPDQPVYMPHTTGPYDQSEVEKRSDVLVYTTPVLEKDTEVTGPVKMILYATTDALSTDFTAKLIDLHPDGKALRICEGITRMAMNGNKASPLQAKPARHEIDLWATSNVFKKGHRIRLEISSSNYPRYHPNTNTGDPLSVATRTKKANQTIHHGRLFPSHLLLPVIE